MLDPTELFPEVPNLYEFPSVHAGMLFDSERMEKYRQAIAKVVNEGDIVADIGTGTGLLAFLCVKAGAKRVHAIERSPAIRWARLLAKKNNLEDRIVFHEKDSRFHDLPEKVDLVVSELIGHVAFEEGMVESLFDAKERFLVPGGTIVPQRVELKVAIVEEDEVYPECIDCWEPIAGIDYSPMREEAIKACYLTVLDNHHLLSEPKTFFTVDFNQDQKPKFAASHHFEICRSGKMNGIALWFDTLLAPDVRLSSGPWTRTHWKQCFAPISNPITINGGDKIRVEIEMRMRTRRRDTFNFTFEMQKEG